MKARIITGLTLAVMLGGVLYVGGYLFAVLYALMLCLSVYEIFKVIRQSEYKCVEWPVWLAVFVSVPLFMEIKPSIMPTLVVVCGAVLLITLMVMLRSKPRLIDIQMSLLPLVAVLLPGCCMLGLSRIGMGYTWLEQPRVFSLMLMILAFAIPLFGDVMAYFIGKFFGRRKLCPEVSPNKTVEGAVAGLFGSIIISVVIYLIFSAFLEEMQPIWHFILLGFIAGIAGQTGDLFASIIKRTCGVKDYGSIFPGHGGAMDRLDSVYWATVCVYIYVNCIRM